MKAANARNCFTCTVIMAFTQQNQEFISTITYYTIENVFKLLSVSQRHLRPVTHRIILVGLDPLHQVQP